MQKEKLVPAIRFKGFDEEWKSIYLSQVATVITGGEPPKHYSKTFNHKNNFIYPVYSNGYDENALWGYADTYKVDKPSITFSSIGTLGFPTIRLEPYTPIIRLKVILPILNQVDLQYLKYALDQSDFMTNASGIPNMNADQVKNIIINSTDINEQQKIGLFFSGLDSLIQFQEQKLKKLQIIKQSLLSKMFASDNQKMPDIRFKDFLDAWNHKLVKSLGYITTGNSNTQESDVNGAYPFFIRSDKPLKSNKYLYDEEAVITIGDGNIGKVFHYINGKFDLHQRCYKISNFTDVLGKYFYWYFSSNFYDRVIRMSAKATVDSVRLEMIADMEIYFPSNKNEQSKISIFLDSLDSLIHSQKQKLEKLNNIKQALLEKMFC
ncbi:restriction endonuclease subunit S [Mycoplasma sp. Sp48II]|uniref:restriction endonuclease subunit S n=1 Tax=unclassified Mycoplasma TaxID=2683645 RepID=UPI003AB00B71